MKLSLFTVVLLGALACGDATPALAQAPAAVPLPQRFPRATPASIQEQIRALSSADAAQRAVAACILGHMGRRADGATSALIAVLGDATAIAPVSCRGTSDFDEVWGVSSYTGGTTPGREAARALGSIGRAAVDPLLQALKSSTPAVRA